MDLTSYVSPDHIGCWQLVRQIYREHFGAELSDNPWGWLPLFREIRQPREGDIIEMRMKLRKGKPFVTDHIGVMLDERSFIHSMEGVGITIGYLDRRPWNDPNRIAGFMRLKTKC